MSDQNTAPWVALLHILSFPVLFQGPLLGFAWGANDEIWMMVIKRAMVLLPAGALVVACWATMFSLVTVIVRQNRSDFVTALMVTWWDLGKAIFAMWGGVFKCAMYLAQMTFAFLRLMVLGLFLFLSDIFLVPFRLVKTASKSAFGAGLPWIAIMLTAVWTLLESTIFTFVMSPLVMDTLSNMTGQQISEKFIRAPLFLFMLFIVLGSYSVLLNLTEALKTRNIPAILKIGVIELVAMFVEVVFLYREFVDALVPWFAQHSAGFQLGITGSLMIAGFTWLGIRSLSWFLFAAHGTPVIMAVIQGRGFASHNVASIANEKTAFVIPMRSFDQIRAEFNWIQSHGDDILGAFLLPPLQVVAATVNFCVLLITAQHLFDLPFEDIKNVMRIRPALKNVNDKVRKEHHEAKHSA